MKYITERRMAELFSRTAEFCRSDATLLSDDDFRSLEAGSSRCEGIEDRFVPHAGDAKFAGRLIRRYKLALRVVDALRRA